MTRIDPAATAARLAPRSAGAVTRGRLTDVERAERKVGGDQLVEQIADLAVVLGWEWLHVGALRTKFGWRTPTRGTLSAWPDLILIRERDRRLIFAECKRQLEPVRPDQERVLEVLRSLVVDLADTSDVRLWPRDPAQAALGLDHAIRRAPRIEVRVWRPSDLRDPIEDSEVHRCLR